MCLAADIEPFKVITDYVAELERKGFLPAEMIPLMGSPAPQPIVLPAPAPICTPPPDPTMPPHHYSASTVETLSSPSINASPIPEPPTLEEDPVYQFLPDRGSTASDEDVEMTDDVCGDTPAAKTQDEGEEDGEEDSGVSSSSEEIVPIRSKRRARLSFDGVEISKRSRLGKAQVDLGGHEFKEGSAVDPELVPLVKGAVCERCTEKGVGGCKVTWHLNHTKVTFRCAFCQKRRNGCSFRNSRWGISTFPTLLKTKQGGARRKEEALQKRISLAKNKPGRSAISTRLTRGKSVESVVSLVPPPESSHRARKTSSKRTTTKEIDTSFSVLDPESLTGHQEMVFFESLNPYAEILRRSDVDSSILRVAMAGARAAMLREEGGLAVVRSLVDDRVVTMKKILDRLDLKMKESLRDEAKDWENDEGGVGDGVEGPSTSRVGS